MPRLCPTDKLERAILLSVLYADLFDHALTFDELLSYLVERADGLSLRAAVGRLAGEGWLELPGAHVVWKDRQNLLLLRRERRKRSSALWQEAREVAEGLAEIPFLRMVGVCGSLAVENVPEGGDIDLFLVTTSGRLWIVQRLAMLGRRRALRRGIDACPNYLLTEANLEVRRRDLHTAREIAHVVPLWGESTYDLFLAANRWIYELLPNLELGDRRRFLRMPSRPSRVERWEGVLGGRIGELMDRLLHRLSMVYYPWRLRQRGVHKSQVQDAYRRDRQEVVGGGYAKAIRERFLARVRLQLGERAAQYAVERLFPAGDEPLDSVPLYGRQLTERYGGRG